MRFSVPIAECLYTYRDHQDGYRLTHSSSAQRPCAEIRRSDKARGSCKKDRRAARGKRSGRSSCSVSYRNEFHRRLFGFLGIEPAQAPRWSTVDDQSSPRYRYVRHRRNPFLPSDTSKSLARRDAFVDAAMARRGPDASGIWADKARHAWISPSLHSRRLGSGQSADAHGDGRTHHLQRRALQFPGRSGNRSSSAVCRSVQAAILTLFSMLSLSMACARSRSSTGCSRLRSTTTEERGLLLACDRQPASSLSTCCGTTDGVYFASHTIRILAHQWARGKSICGVPVGIYLRIGSIPPLSRWWMVPQRWSRFSWISFDLRRNTRSGRYFEFPGSPSRSSRRGGRRAVDATGERCRPPSLVSDVPLGVVLSEDRFATWSGVRRNRLQPLRYLHHRLAPAAAGWTSRLMPRDTLPALGVRTHDPHHRTIGSRCSSRRRVYRVQRASRRFSIFPTGADLPRRP